MVSLLNEARIQKGGKPMGFLNPWIYNHTEMWTDVTKGSNKIGRGEVPHVMSNQWSCPHCLWRWQFALKYGWNCTEGWDPVTGLGTPIFPKMLAAALN